MIGYEPKTLHRTNGEERVVTRMTEEITRLSEKLSKLSLRRLRVIAELQSIELEHDETENQLDEAKKHPKGVLAGRDSKGNSLCSGDSVTTLTKGKYYERIATVVQVNPENHVDIEYKQSGKLTWRLGHNLLKL